VLKNIIKTRLEAFLHTLKFRCAARAQSLWLSVVRRLRALAACTTRGALSARSHLPEKQVARRKQDASNYENLVEVHSGLPEGGL